MSSLDQTITFRAIQERAKDCALEAMPEFPKINTPEAWEAFMADVEAIDAWEVAHESSEWDWVFDVCREMELCQAVPSSVLHEAESQWYDLSGPDGITENFGFYEFACHLAAYIVTAEIAAAVESVKDELIDLAQTQLDNM